MEYREMILDQFGELLNRKDLMYILRENYCTFIEFTEETGQKGPFYDTGLVIDFLGF